MDKADSKDDIGSKRKSKRGKCCDSGKKTGALAKIGANIARELLARFIGTQNDVGIEQVNQRGNASKEKEVDNT